MIHPNGIWIWDLSAIRKDYLDALNQSQCKRIYLKVLDDASRGIFWGWQCTSEVIESFEGKGIEVWGWGYIFNHCSCTDTSGIINALRRALGAGIKGFIFDVEKEVKDPATHPQLREILIQAKSIIPTGCLGYTSFGVPNYHKEVPYKMLNELCDLQFPQIYFEKFTFGSGATRLQQNKAEVEGCIKQHKDLQLNKPILPIWGSESDSQYPATKDELQGYLNSYLGSSIWRAPNAGERGEAWNCKYDADGLDISIQIPAPKSHPYEPAQVLLPSTRDLQLYDQGKDVYVLICALMGLGFMKKTDPVTDVFDVGVDTAVRLAQKQYQIDVDGIVGPTTRSYLENALNSVRAKMGTYAHNVTSRINLTSKMINKVSKNLVRIKIY